MKNFVLCLIAIFTFSAFSFAGDLTREDFLQIKRENAEIKQSVALLSKKVDELSEKVDKVLEVKKAVGSNVIKSSDGCQCTVNSQGVTICPDGSMCMMVDGKCVCIGKVPVAQTSNVTKQIVGYRTERVCDGDTCRTVQVPVYNDVVPVTSSGSCSSGACGSFSSDGSFSSGGCGLFSSGRGPIRSFFRGLFGGFCGG